MRSIHTITALMLIAGGVSGEGTDGIDRFIRSIVTATLAIMLVGAVIYEQLFTKHVDAVLVGWAGLVVGGYFGGHISQTSREAGRAEGRRSIAAEQGREDSNNG